MTSGPLRRREVRVLATMKAGRTAIAIRRMRATGALSEKAWVGDRV
jgi:hypothetical protein